MNVSEGRRQDVLEALDAAAGRELLDRHSDPHHNRSVFTLAGPGLVEAVRAVTRTAIAAIDIARHVGVHPRLGAVDVVPFVPLEDSGLADALGARDAFADWAASIGVPSFLYGPERTLPEIRKLAYTRIRPDVGGPNPHPTAGAICVGARPPMVAYNLWLASDDVALAAEIASDIRSPIVRALGLRLGEGTQVSMNLLEPLVFGPDRAWDFVAARTAIERAELVGLVPAAYLERIPAERLAELDLDVSRTIEARIERMS